MIAEGERANWRRALSGPLGLFAWLFLLFFMAPAPASWAGALRGDTPFLHLQPSQPRGLEHAHGALRDVAVLAGQAGDEKQRHVGDALGLAPTPPTLAVLPDAATAFADHSARPARPACIPVYQTRAPPSLSHRADRPGAPLTQHL
jgi:hypothetical protein